MQVRRRLSQIAATTANDKRLTVAYIRVSTEDQANEGISIPAQEAKLRAYGGGMGWELAEVIVDAGESARTTERPGLQKILGGLRDSSIGRVVVVKLDRLTRSVRDLGDLLDAFNAVDAALISVGENLDTGSASGRLMLHLLVSVSQWEREIVSERTTAALTHKRQERTAYGRTPFGYRREEDRLLPDAHEQEALAEMQRMDVAGMSYRKIAAMLDARGVRPHCGKAWYASTVRAVLRSRIATEAAA
jgi:site-specific DNA recombinase